MKKLRWRPAIRAALLIAGVMLVHDGHSLLGAMCIGVVMGWEK